MAITLVTGQVPSAADWNSYFATKLDVSGAGDVAVPRNLSVVGTGAITGALALSNALTVGTTLSVGGNATVSGALNLAGALTHGAPSSWGDDTTSHSVVWSGSNIKGNARIFQNVFLSGSTTSPYGTPTNYFRTYDTMNAGTAGGNTTSSIFAQMYVGTGKIGNAVGADFHFELDATTANTGIAPLPPGGAQYCGFRSSAWAAASDGGSLGNELGILFGGNITTGAGPSATYLRGVCGLEIDVAINQDVLCKTGLLISQEGGDTHSGTKTDAALVIGNGQPQPTMTNPGWTTGITFGAHDSAFFGMKPTATLITAYPRLSNGDGNLAANGVDFSMLNFSANAFHSPNFKVTGTGQTVSRTFTAFADGQANQLNLFGGDVASNATTMVIAGSDANVGLNINLQGQGGLTVTGTGGGNVLFTLVPRPSSDRWVTIQAGISSQQPQIGVAGAGGNLILGSGTVATTATTGHVLLPMCNGVPTGAPVGANGFALAMDYNTSKVYAYNPTTVSWVALN